MRDPGFDYFYGGESEQFSFYRIPRQLLVGPEFKHVSTDAKLLYGLMLDRMGLSTLLPPLASCRRRPAPECSRLPSLSFPNCPPP